MKRSYGVWVCAVLAAYCTASHAELVVVRVFNFDFSAAPSGPPVDPVIQVGDTVRWVWENGFHDVTSVFGDTEEYASETTFDIGYTFEHTFTQPGVHHYYCSVHGFDNGDGTAGGMSGTVTVLPPVQNVTLDVRSIPENSITIAVSPNDNQNNGAGVTPFTRTYSAGTPVTLIAPSRPHGLAFWRWRQNGTPLADDQNTLMVPAANALLEAEYVVLGDMNGDGDLNNFDIDPFVLALVDPDGYATAFPGLDRLRLGDIDGDGDLNNFDIDPFVNLLIGG